MYTSICMYIYMYNNTHTHIYIYIYIYIYIVYMHPCTCPAALDFSTCNYGTLSQVMNPLTYSCRHAVRVH